MAISTLRLADDANIGIPEVKNFSILGEHMSASTTNPTKIGLGTLGIRNTGSVYWNASTPELYEHIARLGEGYITHLGPIAVRTGHHTGRSPRDKFIVEDGETNDIWWGDTNEKFDPANFDNLYHKMLSYMQNRSLFVQDCFASADPRYALDLRIITEYAWHSLFARNMFFVKERNKLATHEPQFTVIDMPNFHADPELDGTRSEAFVIIHFAKKLVIIGGTSYAGEIKKAVFTVMNYYLPRRQVLSMHCSANYDANGDVALFFGLSGTGKTTLSANNSRTLIGDDEHGWSDDGVFNLEAGCYAKVIRLSPQAEPEIFGITKKFGTILENVAYDHLTRRIDLDDDSLTENTRASYPLKAISNSDPYGRGGPPKHVVMLTADAFGIMPPIARLDAHQAMYYFLNGYTAKVAGTEKGVSEPQATFSTCFGAPFLALHPSKYAEILRRKIAGGHVHCWLVNTGWTGGPYGTGERMKLKYTRRLVEAALSGELDDIRMVTDPVFGLSIPIHCPSVPNIILNPINTWVDGEEFHRRARHLVQSFRENFAQFLPFVDERVKNSGPLL